MKKISLLIISSILLTACSTKSTNTPNQCQNIENELDNISKEKYRDLAAITTKTLTGSYSYGEENKHLDQKIEILKLKLAECKRLKEN